MVALIPRLCLAQNERERREAESPASELALAGCVGRDSAGALKRRPRPEARAWLRCSCVSGEQSSPGSRDSPHFRARDHPDSVTPGHPIVVQAQRHGTRLARHPLRTLRPENRRELLTFHDRCSERTHYFRLDEKSTGCGEVSFAVDLRTRHRRWAIAQPMADRRRVNHSDGVTTAHPRERSVGASSPSSRARSTAVLRSWASSLR